MYLRMILSRMIFELEHSLKTLIISSITNSLTEDGYKIVEDYDMYMQNKFIDSQRKKVILKQTKKSCLNIHKLLKRF